MSGLCARDATLYIWSGGTLDNESPQTPITRDEVVTFVKSGTPDPFATGAGGSGVWEELPNTISINLEPTVEEPTKVRHSGSGGAKVASCPGSVSWTLTVLSELDLQDWLWHYVLTDMTDPTSGFEAWFKLEGVKNSANLVVYVVGTPNPGNLTLDNDADQAAQAEWTIELSSNPVWPYGTDGDEDLTS